MMTWTKIARSDDGSVITYAADGTDERLLVQSVRELARIREQLAWIKKEIGK